MRQTDFASWQNESSMNSLEAKLSKKSLFVTIGQGSMRTYTSAVERFRDCTIQFIEKLDHLAQAQSAYRKAVTASAELRAALDAGEETLRLVMTNLAHAIDPSIRKPGSDEYGQDEATQYPSKPMGEGPVAKKRFP
jgi:hypothetical protein